MKIGFIGLGNVGGKLAGSLLRNKFDLTVIDLNNKLTKSFEKLGAKILTSPKELAEQVDLIITCLPSPKICAKVMEEKNGILEGSEIFIETYTLPVKVIIIGAVHIAQYLVDYAKNLNFEIYIIDPRGYFASEKRFPNVNIINKWPDQAFKDLDTDQSNALIALTHDPKIDDPALKHALDQRFYYIGALGSKKTHSNRCNRLKEAGYTHDQIDQIHGPIGIKLGGKSASEIALSIISQLVLITNNR